MKLPRAGAGQVERLQPKRTATQAAAVEQAKFGTVNAAMQAIGTTAVGFHERKQSAELNEMYTAANTDLTKLETELANTPMLSIAKLEEYGIDYEDSDVVGAGDQAMVPTYRYSEAVWEAAVRQTTGDMVEESNLGPTARQEFLTRINERVVIPGTEQITLSRIDSERQYANAQFNSTIEAAEWEGRVVDAIEAKQEKWAAGGYNGDYEAYRQDLEDTGNNVNFYSTQREVRSATTPEALEPMRTRTINTPNLTDDQRSQLMREISTQYTKLVSVDNKRQQATSRAGLNQAIDAFARREQSNSTIIANAVSNGVYGAELTTLINTLTAKPGGETAAGMRAKWQENIESLRWGRSVDAETGEVIPFEQAKLQMRQELYKARTIKDENGLEVSRISDTDFQFILNQIDETEQLGNVDGSYDEVADSIYRIFAKAERNAINVLGSADKESAAAVERGMRGLSTYMRTDGRDPRGWFQSYLSTELDEGGFYRLTGLEAKKKALVLSNVDGMRKVNVDLTSKNLIDQLKIERGKLSDPALAKNARKAVDRLVREQHKLDRFAEEYPDLTDRQ